MPIKNLKDQWELMRFILSGESVIELNSIPQTSYQQVDELLATIGYHYKQEDERKEIKIIFQEALDFLENTLLSNSRIIIPEKLRNPIDIRDIFLIASKKIVEPRKTQILACAILRLMHVLSHINNVYNRDDYETIKNSIISPYKSNIHLDGKKLYVGKGPDRVPIKSFEYREEKSKESMILKLFHKVGSLAQSIKDQLGVRFITYNKLDIFFLIKQLRDLNIFSFSNVIPGQSRNNLVDMNKFIRSYKTFEKKLLHEKIDRETFWGQLYQVNIDIDNQEEVQDDNIFSDITYRSLQFSIQKLIRYPHPQYKRKMKLLQIINQIEKKDHQRTLKEELKDIKVPRFVHYFFPYEVQIV
ncbi:TIGR04552 family protein [Candidatus Riflebacteria bacterium]